MSSIHSSSKLARVNPVISSPVSFVINELQVANNESGELG